MAGLYDKLKKEAEEDDEPGAMAKKRAEKGKDKKDYAKIGEAFCEFMKVYEKAEGDDDAEAE